MGSEAVNLLALLTTPIDFVNRVAAMVLGSGPRPRPRPLSPASRGPQPALDAQEQAAADALRKRPESAVDAVG